MGGCPPAAGTEGAARSGACDDASARAGKLCTTLGMPESRLRVRGLDNAGTTWDAGVCWTPDPDASCDAGIDVETVRPLPDVPPS